MAASPLPSQGSKRGQKCYTTPEFSRIPNPKRREKKEIRIGCLTPAFSGAQKRAETLHHPCLLRGPQHQVRGEKGSSELAASPLSSERPKRGWKCYITPAFSGVPNAKRGEKKEIRIGCLTPAFLVAPKRAEMLRHRCILGVPITKRGEKKEIRIGCLSRAFSGAQKRTEMLCHPCILGGPQRQVWGEKRNQVWVP